MTGCGVPPELRPQPGAPVPSPSGPVRPSIPPILLPPPSPTVPGAAPTFAENYAVACLGQPSGEQVVSMLRAKTKLLPKTGTISVSTGPLCAGTWQYTIISVPDKEPLHVVTKGAPTALKLVTAGTNICTVEFRTHGPFGLVSAARC